MDKNLKKTIESACAVVGGASGSALITGVGFIIGGPVGGAIGFGVGSIVGIVGGWKTGTIITSSVMKKNDELIEEKYNKGKIVNVNKEEGEC